MANQEQVNLLKQDVQVWNQWRQAHPEIEPDLREAPLSRADLRGADPSGAHLHGADLSGTLLFNATFSGTDLSEATLWGAILSEATLNGATLNGATLRLASLDEATLRGATLRGATLSEADLSTADLRDVDLSYADLSGATLRDADLSGATLDKANLRGATLNGADLSRASLVGTQLTHTTLSACRMYGISFWDVQLESAEQQNLILTPEDHPTIMADNLPMAQLISLLLNHAAIREVVDILPRKVILILGRFSPARKGVLEALQEGARKYDYVPVFLDFETPASRDLTEIMSTLAHLARFILVDFTDPSGAPHEVARVIPQMAVPVQPLHSPEPLLIGGKGEERRELALFQDLRRQYDWVLPTYTYKDQANLLATLKAQVIEPAEQKATDLAQR